MDRLRRVALTGLRLALATAFLSSVAGRLGLSGSYGSGWAGFVKYAGSVNWYLPPPALPAIAITATILETTFGLMSLTGWQIRRAAMGGAKCGPGPGCQSDSADDKGTHRDCREGRHDGDGGVCARHFVGQEVTLGPGQTFYESPDDIHTVSRNADSIKPAKFLVFFVKEKEAPATVTAK